MNSKEALKDLRDVKGWNEVEFNKRLDIIEKALKQAEKDENMVISCIKLLDLNGARYESLYLKFLMYSSYGKSWELRFNEKIGIKGEEE